MPPCSTPCRTTREPSPTPTSRWTPPTTSTPTQGLPPTPIANPGIASIDAALHPETTDYYYYALGKDGKHHFSTTLSEHNAFLASGDYGG